MKNVPTEMIDRCLKLIREGHEDLAIQDAFCAGLCDGAKREPLTELTERIIAEIRDRRISPDPWLKSIVLACINAYIAGERSAATPAPRCESNSTRDGGELVLQCVLDSGHVGKHDYDPSHREETPATQPTKPDRTEKTFEAIVEVDYKARHLQIADKMVAHVAESNKLNERIAVALEAIAGKQPLAPDAATAISSASEKIREAYSPKSDCTCRWRKNKYTGKLEIRESDPNCPVHSGVYE